MEVVMIKQVLQFINSIYRQIAINFSAIVLRRIITIRKNPDIQHFNFFGTSNLKASSIIHRTNPRTSVAAIIRFHFFRRRQAN